MKETKSEQDAQILFLSERLEKIDRKFDHSIGKLNHSIDTLTKSIDLFDRSIQKINESLYMNERSIMTRISVVEDLSAHLTQEIKVIEEKNNEASVENIRQKWKWKVVFCVTALLTSLTLLAYAKEIGFLSWILNLVKELL